MISIKSLSEELLPNVYLKNLSLETNYQSETKTPKGDGYIKIQQGNLDSHHKILSPSDTMTANMMLSMKFQRSKNLQSNLAMLLDSEFAQYYNIYIHQITDKAIFDAVSPSNQSFYNPNGTLTSLGKSVLLGANNPSPQSLSTKRVNLYELAGQQGLNLGGYAKQQKTINLPTQILENGVILNELISNAKFNAIPKDTDFLGYVIISSVDVVGNPDYNEEPIASAVKKEIVILNGQFQDRGLIFTIAPFSPSSTNGQKLLQFGNPGDVWAGPVHYHVPSKTFMAGAKHSDTVPHPVLNYSVVKNTKFVDNRVSEKINETLFDAAKKFSSISSQTVVYRSNKDLLDFPTYKEIPYVSDITLTQDAMRNVEGYFTVDKAAAIADKSYFRLFFQNIEKLINEPLYGTISSDLQQQIDVMSASKLIRCSVKNNNETLATVDETSFASSPAQVFDYVNDYSSPSNTISFTLEKANLLGSTVFNKGVETFLFKHKMGNDNDLNAAAPTSMQKYSVEIEYSDPTINLVKTIRAKTNNALTAVQSLIKYVDIGVVASPNTTKGFDPITGKINNAIVQKLLSNTTENPLLATSEINTGAGFTQTTLVLNAIKYLPYGYIYAFFYSPALQASVSLQQFVNYFTSCCNIKTTTVDNLLKLESLLQHMVNAFDAALKPIGATGPKVTKGAGYIDSVSKGNVKGLSKRRTIELKSKNESKITTYDYGYDFTGIIDSEKFKEFSDQIAGFPASTVGINTGLFTASGNKRNKDSFLKIQYNDYTVACAYNFSEIIDITKVADQSLSFVAAYQPLSALEIMFSFLSTPCLTPEMLKSCVVLPSSVFVAQTNSPQLVFTSIAKLKKQIFENNRFFINQPKDSFGGQAVSIALAEDLITLHARQGVTFPLLTQTQFVKIGNQTIEDSENDTDIPESEGNDQEDNAPQFAINFKLEYTDTKKNNIMSSLFNKMMMNKVTKGFSFDYKGYLSSLDGNYSPQQILQIQGGKESLQTLCLAVNNPSQSPFKDYMNSDQGYIVNGAIDPTRLSQFFFLHQNVVKVEYLSGYESPSYDVVVPDDNPYTSKKVSNTKRNINKPIWKILNRQVLQTFFGSDSNSTGQLLCRVVRYDSPFINKFLVKQFEMPFINSHFILHKG